MEVRIISLLSSEYPITLKECADAPIALFAIGKLPAPLSFTMGIVGTRTPSEYGKVSTQQIIQECIGKEIVILSGLALGVDAIAHREALATTLPTVAILAHGFQYIYPAQHKQLALEIIQSGGALISEYPPSTRIEKHHFAARNRIIAG